MKIIHTGLIWKFWASEEMAFCIVYKLMIIDDSIVRSSNCAEGMFLDSTTELTNLTQMLKKEWLR